MKHVTVLISSAGRRVSLMRAFRSAAKELSTYGRVIATDASPLSAAGWDADVYEHVPPCRHSDFIPTMLDLCELHDVDMIIPTIDTELPIYAENREAFETIGVSVIVSSPETIAICADKVATHDFLVKHDIPAVKQTQVTDLQDISGWNYPLVAKPREGSASAGVRYIHDPGDVGHLGSDYIVQTLAPGSEYTCDAYIDRSGAPVSIIPRLRIETRGGEVSKGRTERVDAINDVVRDTCRALPGAVGVVTVQLFYDLETGTINVIEINPRFGGGYPLSHHAGADFPARLLREWTVKETADTSDAWREGVTMLRFDDAIYLDAADL